MKSHFCYSVPRALFHLDSGLFEGARLPGDDVDQRPHLQGEGDAQTDWRELREFRVLEHRAPYLHTEHNIHRICKYMYLKVYFDSFVQ